MEAAVAQKEMKIISLYCLLVNLTSSSNKKEEGEEGGGMVEVVVVVVVGEGGGCLDGDAFP